MNEILEQLKKRLKEAEVKATPARLEIIKKLASVRKPVSVDQLAKLAPSVDLATVYRAVNALTECGILKKVNLQSGQAFFELSGGHHHHLVCSNCGSVRDFGGCGVSGLERKIRKTGFFSKLNGHSLEFFGICRKCDKFKH